MKWILQRFSDNRQSTLGLLYKVGALTPFFSYTLEDEFRESKKTGETRVPAMTYNLILQKTETPKTLQYRKKYPWFIFHIMLENVPGFVGVYLHIGNNEDDTDGCILLGDSADNNTLGPGTISQSTNAFRRFYGQVFEAISKGEIVTLEIRDEKFLQLQ
jgi:hypothetical protein